MALLLKAHEFATEAPREALTDAFGFAGLCALIFAGFTFPAFF
jgi:hypothetical protein